MMEPSRATRGATREVADCSFRGRGPLPRHPVTGRLVHVPTAITAPSVRGSCGRELSQFVSYLVPSTVALVASRQRVKKGAKHQAAAAHRLREERNYRRSTAAPSISGRRRAHRPPTKLAISETALNRTVLRACRLQNARVSDAAHRCACHAAPGTRLTTRSAPSRCRHRWRSGERTRRRICR